MIFIKAFQDLFSLLTFRARLRLGLVLVLLIIIGLLEMVGISLIFTYVGALSGAHSGGIKTQIILRTLGIERDTIDQNDFITYGGALLVLFFVLKNISVLAIENIFSRFLRAEVQRVSAKLFEAYTAMPYENFFTIGIPRLTDLITRFPRLFISGFTSIIGIVTNFTKITTIIFLLMFINKHLAIIGLSLFGTLSAMTYIFTKRENQKLHEEKKGKRNYQKEMITDILHGFIDVNLMNVEKSILEKYDQSFSRSSKISTKQSILKKIPKATNEVLLSIAIVTATSYFYFIEQNLSYSLPVLFIFTFAGLKLNNFFTSMTNQFQNLYFSANTRNNTINRIKQIMPGLLEDDKVMGEFNCDEASSVDGLDFEKNIIIQDLSFTYPDANERVIKKLNLEINKGDFIGICGRSGGGKTTLLLLMMGLLQPDSGQIFCDGKMISENPKAWHRNIGFVGQNPYVSASSIKKNIAFGFSFKKSNEERVWECLRMAGLEDFVKALPDGLNTRLKDAGINISEGQKQRLCIARALYKNPSILIFDEATSALDYKTESELKTTINKLRGRTTIICVTHRVASLHDAQKIYVIDAGEIIDSGTYAELQERKIDAIQG